MYQSASALNDDEFYNKNGFVTPSNREVTCVHVHLRVCMCTCVCDATVASFGTHPIPAIPVIRIGNLNPHTQRAEKQN